MLANQPQKQLSAMSFDMAGAAAGVVPTEAHLLPAKDFVPDDGRELSFDSFKMSASIAKSLIAKMGARKNDTLIDYEHQSLFTTENGKPAIAAGWFRKMEYRPDGLWAVDIQWTEQAKKYIASKEYRYISAVFWTDNETGEILEIESVTLTNTPAIDGLKALAALSKNFNQDLNLGDLNMSGTEITTLTAERDSLKTTVTALTTERDTLKTNVVALTADLKAATDKLAAVDAETKKTAAEAEKKAHGDLLQTALSDGRLAPAQKAWAEKQSLAALSEFLEVSKPMVEGKRQATGEGGDANHGLNEADLEMATRMGVSVEAFAKTKASEEAKRKQFKG